ncbi:PREDICTED: THAP domain-containing protein 4-like [Vollenhovia emeryi]|uniref:THAP domain-containing protein 4-like n=1 Tax=Vollenhovia emeryi TaxID=411798 RepID=UPI0005F39747|nr:PREDICTED: THAP domain-containing protein 4-like [Vollenhovia emeryi]
MASMPLHEALGPLAWLEGTWLLEGQGDGKYPTIQDFNYYEELSFTSMGQPMFNYTAQSYALDLRKPMHRETGFVKVNPATGQVTLISAHSFGLTTIECGETFDNAVTFNSTDITRMEGAKMPHVTQVRREFKLHDNCLEYVLYMATSNTPVLTEHLRAKYVKASEGFKRW